MYDCFHLQKYIQNLLFTSVYSMLKINYSVRMVGTIKAQLICCLRTLEFEPNLYTFRKFIYTYLDSSISFFRMPFRIMFPLRKINKLQMLPFPFYSPYNCFIFPKPPDFETFSSQAIRAVDVWTLPA